VSYKQRVDVGSGWREWENVMFHYLREKRSISKESESKCNESR
jgi:hypothetical protein